jgi:multicomponent Na+:H+ antiporter subunit D
MIGLPPFIGFISKWFLAMGSLEAMRLGNYWPGIGLIALLTLLLSSLLNLVYYGPVVIGAWMHGNGESANDSDPAKNDEADNIMLIPMLLLSVGVFIFGITPRIPLDFVRKISKIFFP